MNAATFLHAVIRSGLRFMAGTLANPRLDTPAAELLLLAIALQESAATHRWQLGRDGQPLANVARGWWQFERGGGFRGIREHARTKPLLEALVAELSLPTDEEAQWQALPHSELLQTCFARLLLWSDNAPLPAVGDKDAGWAVYLRLWRPGKPHRDRWDASYQGALDVAKAAGTPTRPSDGAVPDLLDTLERTVRLLRSAVA